MPGDPTRRDCLVLERVRPANLDEVEHIIDAMPLTVDRLSTTTAEPRFLTATLGALQLVAGHFGSAIHTYGAAEADRALVAFQMEPARGHWNGETMRVGSAWCYPPGADHEGVGQHPVAFAAISLPGDQLARLAGDGPASRSQMSVHAGPAVHGLRRVVTDLAGISGRMQVGDSRLADAGRELGGYLTECLALCEPRGYMYAPTARHIVDQCIEASSLLGPRPSSVDLEEITRVSDRRIRAAFNEVFGIPVSLFFRMRALHGAHRDLSRTDRRQTSVTDVALRWGFWHFGRFSGQYKQLFGQTPSETLRQ